MLVKKEIADGAKWEVVIFGWKSRKVVIYLKGEESWSGSCCDASGLEEVNLQVHQTSRKKTDTPASHKEVGKQN